MVDNGVKTTNRKAVYCCCCCTFTYFIFPCINVFMFKNYLYVYKKKEIFINMSFIYVTFLKWCKLQVNSVCNISLLFQIVVNVKKKKKQIKKHSLHTLHVSSYVLFLNEFVRCHLTLSRRVERARNPAFYHRDRLQDKKKKQLIWEKP